VAACCFWLTEDFLMTKAFRFVVARLSEPSTFRGITLALTGVGVYVRPEIAAAVTSIGLGVAGLIGIFFPDASAPAAPAE
jgi:hypothetical protein